MFESSWPGPRFAQPGGTQLRTLPIASDRFVFERREPEEVVPGLGSASAFSDYNDPAVALGPLSTGGDVH